MQGKCRENAGKMQGKCRENAGKMQGKYKIPIYFNYYNPITIV